MVSAEETPAAGFYRRLERALARRYEDGAGGAVVGVSCTGAGGERVAVHALAYAAPDLIYVVGLDRRHRPVVVVAHPHALQLTLVLQPGTTPAEPPVRFLGPWE